MDMLSNPLSQFTPLLETRIDSLPLLARGKVRDIYAVDDRHLLIVATDRLSAFDVILPTPIPGKGILLTRITEFWFRLLADVVPNHLTGKTLDELPLTAEEKRQLAGRSMIVKHLRPLPVEAIVRGYLIGSGWKDYQASGSVCGITLPGNIPLAGRLPAPIFTPSTKAEVGGHDINIDLPHMAQLLGKDLSRQVIEVSQELYRRAAEYAQARGIIIADTKFEFGLDENGQLVLMDEILTPDSSRFWPQAQYQPGTSPPSFDKQFVRDYLETLGWDKTAPGPEIPVQIVGKTAEKYLEVVKLLIR
ncbi:MAG TPA: phosphoribosylaminoimidazolesuccinocarboxamide synthase [Thiolinea sp.]|nr:phosphoribosylaminoimidazolesuccinocarboxamide synthase [Thiolinea sp.]